MVMAVRPSHGADQPIPGTRLTLRATSVRARLTFVARDGFTLPPPPGAATIRRSAVRRCRSSTPFPDVRRNVPPSVWPAPTRAWSASVS